MFGDQARGHPYAIFRRALEGRHLPAAWAAAADLKSLTLPDALARCLLVRDREPHRFARVALRWHARFCAETAAVGLEEGRLVLDLLGALATEEARPAGRALRELLASLDQRLSEPLRPWEAEQAAEATARRAI
jgi:hypothetical protein